LNLGQAKSILIIAFLGLNLFLGYQLFWPDFGRLTNVAVTAEELSGLEKMLDENNYVMETSIDRGVKKSEFLKVSANREVKEGIIKNLIGQVAEVDYTDEIIHYRASDLSILEHQSGLIQVDFNEGVCLGENTEDLDKSEMQAKVEEFLAENELKFEGLRFDSVEKENEDQETFLFNQELDGKPIFSGHFRVKLDGGTVNSVAIYWLKPVERIPEREMEVIPATDALHNLVNNLGPGVEKRKINKVELGYYTEEYEAEKWEIPPVWRITLDEKEHYYINAFTGNLEQEPVILEELPANGES